MAKNASDNEITSTAQDWALDERNGLPFSGQSVQNFIKRGIDTANAAYAERAGAFYFNPVDMKLYFFKNEEDKEEWLNGGDNSLVIGTPALFSFSGMVNEVKVVDRMDGTSLYFTTTQETAEINVGFLSRQKGITDLNWE